MTSKIIQSGNIVEVYDYENGFLKGYTLNESERAKVGRKAGGNVSANSEENRDKVLRRAKTRLRRLINSNVNMYGEITPKFLTLTFRENVTSVKIANYEFKKFVKRLNYQVFKDKKVRLKYSCVVEFQKRGAVHYHVIFYNLPYLESGFIAEIWGQGFIKINKIDKVDNVGAYVTKYMSKQGKDERLVEEKSYFNSRGLIQPIEFVEEKEVEAIKSTLPIEKLRYESVFENDYLGQILYRQYNYNT